jgi:hypothetical protein
MNATESEAGAQATIEKEIIEREAAATELQKKIQPALAQVTRRKDETAKAAGEFDRCRTAYQDECRKLAGGQKAAVDAATRALNDAEARLEGSRLLLSDEEGVAAALQQESLSIETRLKELRDLRQVEIDRAEIGVLGESVQNALDNFRKRATEADERLKAQSLRWTGEQNNRRADRLRTSIGGILRHIGGINIL